MQRDHKVEKFLFIIIIISFVFILWAVYCGYSYWQNLNQQSKKPVTESYIDKDSINGIKLKIESRGQ